MRRGSAAARRASRAEHHDVQLPLPHPAGRSTVLAHPLRGGLAVHADAGGQPGVVGMVVADRIVRSQGEPADHDEPAADQLAASRWQTSHEPLLLHARRVPRHLRGAGGVLSGAARRCAAFAVHVEAPDGKSRTPWTYHRCLAVCAGQDRAARDARPNPEAGAQGSEAVVWASKVAAACQVMYVTQEQAEWQRSEGAAGWHSYSSRNAPEHLDGKDCRIQTFHASLEYFSIIQSCIHSCIHSCILSSLVRFIMIVAFVGSQSISLV
mmetsp:Transcript_19277/g.53611  ORF Transcript_19277/g.53611 Transcript_19277/m.53611 type:complete len:266 (-) Transcript_19277:492-1289(-)